MSDLGQKDDENVQWINLPINGNNLQKYKLRFKIKNRLVKRSVA